MRIVGKAVLVGQNWSREDLWTGENTARPVPDPLWSTGPGDESECHQTYPSGYDERCA